MTRIRIKDIAKMANVSPGTVDRVIHHRPGVSPGTRKRIESIIESVDYKPDIIAGHLATNRSYRFLIIMPHSVRAHEFWDFPLAGVHRALEEIRFFDVATDYIRFDQHNRDDFVQKVSDVSVSSYDALLFAPVFTEESMEFLKQWAKERIPFVLFNSRLESATPISFIGQDARQSGYLGGKLLSYGLEWGRDLLIVNLTQRKDSYEHIIKREKGFRDYFEAHSDRLRNLVTLEMNTGNYDRIAAALDRHMERYDIAGIFVTNSRVHLVAKYLADAGAMSVRLVGYDLLPQSLDYLRREYIDFLISQRPEEQAYLGIMHLFNRVIMKQSVAEEVLLPIDILTRENIQYYQKYKTVS